MDQRVRLLANVEAYSGDVALVTVTAPGRDRIRSRSDISAWNLAAPDTWREGHRAARQTTIRTTGTKPEVLVWEWEFQKRGALHKHVVLGMGTAAARRAAHVYALALEEELQRRGWGWADGGGRSWRSRGLKGVQGIGAARYLAKYLAPVGEGSKLALSETATRPEVPPLVVYVSKLLTDRTGITMRSLRWRRLCWVLGYDPKTGELVPRGEAPPGPPPAITPVVPAGP